MTKAPNSADSPIPGSYLVKTVQDVLGSTACPTSLSTYSSTLPTFVNGALSGPNSGATQGGQSYSVPCSTAMYDHGLQFNQAQPFDGLQFSARIDQVFRPARTASMPCSSASIRRWAIYPPARAGFDHSQHQPVRIGELGPPIFAKAAQ